jgi:preprotein translocase subunit SecF
MQFNIVKKSGLWFGISGVLILASIVSIAIFGLNLSSDFVEGSLLEIKFQNQVEPNVLMADLQSFKDVQIGNMDAKTTSAGTIMIRAKRMSESDSEAVLDHLRSTYGSMEVIQNRSVSPVFAKTFKARAFTAIGFASVAIVLYIAFAFRKVSKGIKSWKLGVSAILALIHDVVITVGVFAVLGRFLGVEVDALFITALLTIMGFSVHDTIVVFDRVRENLINKSHDQTLEMIAEKSIHETMARSINTSLTTVIVLVALMIFGSPSIFWFVFALTVGITVGTYSSVFIASPLLVWWQKRFG